jgi:hypothetical protein
VTPPARVVRPAILAVLLAGIVLTLVLAPSALEAQQTPPGTAGGTAGYGERLGPTAREIALEPLARDGGDPTWWIVSAIAVIVIGSSAGVLYLRRKA